MKTQDLMTTVVRIRSIRISTMIYIIHERVMHRKKMSLWSKNEKWRKTGLKLGDMEGGRMGYPGGVWKFLGNFRK